MANQKGAEERNRREIIALMEEAYSEDRLNELETEWGEPIYALLNKNNKIVAAVYISDGAWVDSKAGKNKSNKRDSVNIPLPSKKSYMCANYTFRVIAEGLLSTDHKHQERFKKFKEGVYTYRKLTREEAIEHGFSKSEIKSGVYGPRYDPSDINHINGDTQDNSDENLEVDTEGMNKAHSRLMSEVHFYFPKMVIEEVDCQGNKMHRWVDGVGVSCKDIRKYNETHKKNPIKAAVDKKGSFNPRYTYYEVLGMLQYFGKEIISEND